MSKKIIDIKHKEKAVGLVVEYNPFHNGHKYHLEKAKEMSGATIVVAVMSGDFVQRGEPAAFNRYLRSKMAMDSGVDLLVELPAIYSTQNAEIFALGAINTLLHLEVDEVVFGSESGDVESLQEIAKLEEDQLFKESINTFLKKGLSYPAAFSEALKSLSVDTKVNSNDILGIEYLRAKNRLQEMYTYLDRNCKFRALKRIGVGYHDTITEGNIASATGIRNILKEKNSINDFVPNTSAKIIEENEEIAKLEDFYPLIRYSIINNYSRLLEIQDVEEGLENRLYQCATKFSNFNDFMKEVMTKRYTKGRIQRVLIHILLNITSKETIDVKYKLPFIKVLAFNEKGQSYLKSLKNSRNEKVEKLGVNPPKIIMGMRNIRKELNEKERKKMEFNEEASLIYKMISSYKEEGVIITTKNKICEEMNE